MFHTASPEPSIGYGAGHNGQTWSVFQDGACRCFYTARRMNSRPRVAVIGDFSESNETHRATNAELSAAGATFAWVPTHAIDPVAETLGNVDALWISPGSPYASMEGALRAIRYARERAIPLVGT